MLLRIFHEITAFVFQACWAERRVTQKIKCLEQKLENQQCDATDVRNHLSSRIIRQHHEQEKARRASIEDKAKKNLFAVTVATAAAVAGIGLMTGRDSSIVFRGPVGGVAGLALLVGILFLLFAALTALRAMRIWRVYDMALEDEAKETSVRKSLLLAYISLNQLHTTVRSNWAYASDACIRNGLLALAAFAVTTVAIALLGAADR
jgi:hypothetical protein